MEKKFTMENDVGIEVNYTILARTDDYVVYTNYMPSDNELGVRLLVGKIISEEPLKIEKVRLAEQKKIVDEFTMAMIASGKKIRRVRK